jgi:hypothetical protein
MQTGEEINITTEQRNVSRTTLESIGVLKSRNTRLCAALISKRNNAQEICKKITAAVTVRALANTICKKYNPNTQNICGR